MSNDKMTSRERILATIYGKPIDRYPVWLKMTNQTWRSAQPEEVRALIDEELLAAAGCDPMLGNGLSVDQHSPDASCTTEVTDGTRTQTYQTTEGNMIGVHAHDPYTRSWHPTEYPVKTADDLKRLQAYVKGSTYQVTPENAAKHAGRQREIEDKQAISMCGIGPGPLMAMVEHWAGPENAIYLMMDEREAFEETLEALHQDRIRRLEATLPAMKADTFWLTENTSTTLISPTIFEDYCMPHLAVYGNMVLESGTIPVHHMCGTLNALLEMIDQLPALVNEAYTTRPLGDCSLTEGRTRMPSKALIGGTNATLWMEDIDTIVQTVADDLATCPDRSKIFLTSAGVLTPLANLEKARAVVEGLKELPV